MIFGLQSWWKLQSTKRCAISIHFAYSAFKIIQTYNESWSLVCVCVFFSLSFPLFVIVFRFSIQNHIPDIIHNRNKKIILKVCTWKNKNWQNKLCVLYFDCLFAWMATKETERERAIESEYKMISKMWEEMKMLQPNAVASRRKLKIRFTVCQCSAFIVFACKYGWIRKY